MELVTAETFFSDVETLAVLKDWWSELDEDATSKAITALYMLFPKDALSKQPKIFKESYERAYQAIADNPFAKPADLKSEYSKCRLSDAKTALATAPALPPATDTTDLRNSRGGEEYVRFKRFGRQLMAARREGRKFFPKDEYAERWNAPLAEEDWARASNTDPAQAIAGATGGHVPAADPKEEETIWI